MGEQIKRHIKERGYRVVEAWMTLTPDYAQGVGNEVEMGDFMREHGLFLTPKNLDLAWKSVLKNRMLGRFETLTDFDRQFLKDCGVAI